MDRINFWLPINIEKSSSPQRDDDSRYDNMVFTGLASDSSEDDEGESMEPNGFILDRFLKSGLLNLDHLPSRAKENKSSYWIGEPIDAWVKDNKFFVKGKLWKKSPEARAFWDKCLQMEESGSSRKPGMSIEGRVIERDAKNPRKVKKALITNVALTFQPVNTNSFVDIIKGKQKQDFIDYGNDPANNVLLTLDAGRSNVTIGTDLRVTVSEKPKIGIDSIRNLYKSYESGEVTKKILDVFVKKIQENFCLSD